MVVMAPGAVVMHVIMAMIVVIVPMMIMAVGLRGVIVGHGDGLGAPALTR